MSSPIDAILTSLLTGQGPSPLAMGTGVDAAQDFGANGPQPAETPMRPEDLIASPNPSQPHPADLRMEGIRRMLTDFTFSLGSGLSAASANPRGRAQRNQAGAGAILQAPEFLRKAQEAQQAQADQQKLGLAQLILQKRQQDQTAANQAATLAETQRLRATEEQNAQTQRDNMLADNARADAIAQQPKTQDYPAGSLIVTRDAKGNEISRETVPAKEPNPAQPKSLQNDEYLLKDGTHPVLSFDPTPTPQRPAGTYLNVNGQDVTQLVVGKYKPPAATNTASSETASYKYHSDKLLALAKPVDDAANRSQRLSDNLNLHTAQADTILAPELLTVTSGGLGSGLRINEAEINRVQGGRPMIAQLQAKWRQWLGTDQKTAINYGHEERQAMADIVNLVNDKLTAKQQALSYFGDLNSQDKVTEQQRRTGLSDLEKQLRAVDQGKILAPDPTGKLHIFDTPEQAAQFRKATGQ
jgi:hypothetical protein